MYNLTVGDN